MVVQGRSIRLDEPRRPDPTKKEGNTARPDRVLPSSVQDPRRDGCFEPVTHPSSVTVTGHDPSLRFPVRRTGILSEDSSTTVAGHDPSPREPIGRAGILPEEVPG